MPIFMRRSSAPPPRSNYRDYRQEVREDFVECCAYCLLSELIAHGGDSFDLDHFRPKSLPAFSHLTDEFFNLYYACHPCNRYKGNRWPSDDLASKGRRFVDFCSELFADHFEALPDGRWNPISRAGEYTEAKLRLNRTHLQEVRALLYSIAVARQKMPIDWNLPTRDKIAELLEPHQ